MPFWVEAKLSSRMMGVIGRKIAEGYKRLSSLPPSCETLMQSAIIVDDSRERRVILTKKSGYVELEIELDLPDPTSPVCPDVWSSPQALKMWITQAMKPLEYILGLADLGFRFEVLEPDSTIVASLPLTGPPCQTLLQGVDSWGSE